MPETIRRLDIQGLRAVAVLSVLAYHLHLPVSGGFVGVDIFFVISGFLITGIISREFEAGRFGVINFALRRARRLLPALFATIAASFVFSAMLFTPQDLQRASEATLYALLEVANVYFWRTSGYFDVASTLKPLLHTWSLAVEVQFYLVWPLVVIAALKRRIPLIVLGVIFTASLTASIYVMRLDPVASFYLTPLRVHEFAIGGIISLLPPLKNRLLRELGAILGLVAIVFTVFAYGPETVFPGLSTLPPTVGAALLIYCGPGNLISRALAMRAPEYVGEISYSLYLVHWPTIVLIQYQFGHPLGALESAAAAPLIVSLALVLYYGVERPSAGQPAIDRERQWSSALRHSEQFLWSVPLQLTAP